MFTFVSTRIAKQTVSKILMILTLTFLVDCSNYLAWGNGQGSTLLPWQELRAFSIEGGQLTEPDIFPDKMSKVFVEFDLHAFGENPKVPVIRIKNDGKVVQVPIAGTKQGFSGRYKTYVFNGREFILR